MKHGKNNIYEYNSNAISAESDSKKKVLSSAGIKINLTQLNVLALVGIN
jgi:hypothetical protein